MAPASGSGWPQNEKNVLLRFVFPIEPLFCAHRMEVEEAHIPEEVVKQIGLNFLKTFCSLPTHSPRSLSFLNILSKGIAVTELAPHLLSRYGSIHSAQQSIR